MLKKSTVSIAVLALITGELPPATEAMHIKNGQMNMDYLHLSHQSYDGNSFEDLASGSPQSHQLEEMYYEKGELPISTPTTNIKTKVKKDEKLSFIATSCMSGIERFINGTSNSIETYDAAMKQTQLWEDPEFGADVTSVNWAG